MRNAEDYKKLVDGYGFSLSLLKEVNEKLFNKFMRAKDLLSQDGAHFAELVRDLKVDFVNENDDKESGDPKVFVVDSGIYKEIFALSFSPQNSYIFGMLYAKRTPLGIKKIFCEIVPRNLEDVKKHTVTDVFRISTLDSNGNVVKCHNYIAGIVEDCLVVLKQNVDNPKSVHGEFEIKLSEIQNIQVDVKDMF